MAPVADGGRGENKITADDSVAQDAAYLGYLDALRHLEELRDRAWILHRCTFQRVDALLRGEPTAHTLVRYPAGSHEATLAGKEGSLG